MTKSYAAGSKSGGVEPFEIIVPDFRYGTRGLSVCFAGFQFWFGSVCKGNVCFVPLCIGNI